MKRRKPRTGGKKPQSASKTSEIKELTLESVAFGGDALTRLDGKVYFVADAIPGERVEAEIIQDKERFAKARVLKRLAPAPDAIPAPCRYVDRCGGCQWQTVPYQKQLQWKASFIQDALQRIGGIPSGSYPFTMQASPQEYAYRNRIEVKWKVKTTGAVELGYFAKGSHEWVMIDHCLIADQEINKVLKSLLAMRFPARERPFSTSLELQAIEDGRVLISSADVVPSELQSEFLKQQFILNPRDFFLLETWEGLRFHTRAGQFQQVNIPANRFLRSWVRDFANAESVQNVIDLYCGSGNLSLALGRAGLHVLGVEAYGPSIEAAHYNVRENSVKAAYAEGDAEDIRKIQPDMQTPDLLIVDPPRRGLETAITPALELRAKTILYVSCDPNTLARDLRQFLSQGYKIRQVMGLDFFPQSYHVETICVLDRAI